MNTKTNWFLKWMFVFTTTAISTNVFSQSLITVTDCNLNGWERHQQAGVVLGTITFVNGPSTPLLGNGSVQFNSPDRKFIRLRNNQFVGTLLSNITELSYSTYVQQTASIADNIFIVLSIDINNDGIVDFPVVFNTFYQTGQFVTGIGPDQGATLMNTWQTWDMLNGVWWRGPSPDPDNGGNLFTLSTLINQYPHAKIMNQGPTGPLGSIRINGSSPVFSGHYIGYVDNFKIGVNSITTTFDFEGTIANAGADQTVVYGYGSNCTTLMGIGTGGVAPYSYSWSGLGFSSNSQNPNVCPTANTTYTLTVTDSRGCSGTNQVTVFVNDVRCGNGNNKVLVCHKGETICIASSAVASHLAHGDILGACPPLLTTANKAEIINISKQFSLSNYPNPSTNVTSIRYHLPIESNVSITIYDLSGKMIGSIANGNKTAGYYSIDFSTKNLRSGMYYYKMTATSATKIFSQTNKMIVVQ